MKLFVLSFGYVGIVEHPGGFDLRDWSSAPWYETIKMDFGVDTPPERAVELVEKSYPEYSVSFAGGNDEYLQYVGGRLLFSRGF